MVTMQALIDNRRYFDRIEYYYRMFSFDLTYYTDSILIEPRRINRISTRSISSLLQTLLQYGRQEKHFLIATHGNPNGLPIRIRAANAATMNSDFMDKLDEALGGSANARQYAMSYEANGARVFQNEQQLDDLLNLIRSVRQLRLEHLEFRGCNIGAGPALRSLHKLLGARLTAAPTVQFMWTRLATTSYRSISAGRFQRELQRLPPDRRTFTRIDCYSADTGTKGDEIVVAIGLAGNSIRLIARDTNIIKGWTQAYLQRSILFALGQEPPGGGYRPRGYLPFVGFLTPTGRHPFVVPGDLFDYTSCLAYEMQPPRWP